jgi:hypothetical protein
MVRNSLSAADLCLKMPARRSWARSYDEAIDCVLLQCMSPRLAQNEERERAGREAGSRRGLGQEVEMTTTRTHFTFRVDTWTPDGESIVEHVAGIENCHVALATYRAACERWPGIPITLRRGAQVIEDSRRLRVV